MLEMWDRPLSLENLAMVQGMQHHEAGEDEEENMVEEALERWLEDEASLKMWWLPAGMCDCDGERRME